MKKNMGTADRIIRTVAALVLGILLLTGTLQGTLATVMAIVAIMLLVTSAFSVCPLYIPLKISTLKKGEGTK